MAAGRIAEGLIEKRLRGGRHGRIDRRARVVIEIDRCHGLPRPEPGLLVQIEHVMSRLEGIAVLGGWRMVREAVQDERRLTIGVTTPQRVKGAVWQVEGDVFELHVCQASPRAVGWGSKPGGRPSPRPPATA
jgi:hypothetical protein